VAAGIQDRFVGAIAVDQDRQFGFAQNADHLEQVGVRQEAWRCRRARGRSGGVTVVVTFSSAGIQSKRY
jgi:hypothetical protein